MSLANFNYITQTNSQFQVNTTDTVSTPGYSWSSGSTTGIYGGGQNYIGFVINGTERLRIASNGNIGIGAGAITNTPALFNLNASTSYTNTIINQTGFGDVLDVQAGSSSKLFVKNNGSVGINTNNPSVQLHSYSALISNPASYTPNLMGIYPIAILEEQIASAAGTSVTGTGTSTVRQLNTIITDSLGTSVSLNTGANSGTYRFTLPIGSYFINAEGNAAVALVHRLLLTSTAGITPINIYGTSEGTNNATISSKSTISTVLSLSSATTFELRTISSGAGTLGLNSSIGSTNTYARIIITRLQ